MKERAWIFSLRDACPGRLPWSSQCNKYCERTERVLHSHVLRPPFWPMLERSTHSLWSPPCLLWNGECAHTNFSDEESKAQKDAVIIWACSWEPFGREATTLWFFRRGVAVSSMKSWPFHRWRGKDSGVKHKSTLKGCPVSPLAECPISPLADIPKAVLLLT